MTSPRRRDPRTPGKLTLGLVLAGMTLGSITLLAWPIKDARAFAGSLGFMAAVAGGLIALWFSFWHRDARCYPAVALSLPSLVLWAWIIQLAILS